MGLTAYFEVSCFHFRNALAFCLADLFFVRPSISKALAFDALQRMVGAGSIVNLAVGVAGIQTR